MRSPEPCAAHRKAPEYSARFLALESFPQEKGPRVPRPDCPTCNRKQTVAGWNPRDEARSGLLNPKSPGRRPSRLHVGKVERVQLCPKNVALRAQRRDRQILLNSGSGILSHKLQSESRVFRSLIETRCEIVKPSGKPRVMLPQTIHT